MTEAEHENRCPLSAVDRRLADVHRHWHEAEHKNQPSFTRGDLAA